MTVKEMIEKLSNYDESLEVSVAIRIFGYESISNYYNIESIEISNCINKDEIEIICNDYSN